MIVTVDADHTGFESTRKSTSAGVTQLNGHMLTEWSQTQTVVALSSGESEFIAIVRGIAVGLFAKNLLTELGWNIETLTVRSDSSAARGMTTRLGVGRKCKHLETKSLFAQHLVTEKKVYFETVWTKDNVADIGTKYLDRGTLKRLLTIVGITLMT